MKNFGYLFSFPIQAITALIVFVVNAGAAYLVGDAISWLPTIAATTAAFFAAGIRYYPSGQKNIHSQ